MKMHTFEFVKDYFENISGFHVKRMFGGQALRIFDKMVLVLMDGEETSYRGKEYGVKIWYGLLVPTCKEHHLILMKKFPFLKPHRVLGKWLFLSAESDDFEEHAELLCEEIIRGNQLFGIVSHSRKI